jgi:hypothetical protein
VEVIPLLLLESDRADLRFVEAGAVNALADFRGNEFFDTR